MNLAVIALVAATAISGAAGQPSEPVPVHFCSETIDLAPGGQMRVGVDKAFRLDGTPYSMNAQVEIGTPSFLRARRPVGYHYVTLAWPGSTAREPQTFLDWAMGSIRFNMVINARLERQELWTQILVDRNRSLIIYAEGGEQMLIPSPLDMYLMGEAGSPSASPVFSTSLGSLLAWGSGTSSVTLYVTAVMRRPYTPNAFPNGPLGRRRILAAFDLDTAALDRIVHQTREAVTRWERDIATRWGQCQRTTVGDEIIITG